MNGQVTLSWDVHFQTKAKGRRELQLEAAQEGPKLSLGRVSRVSRLMALAIHFQELLHTGKVKDYAEIARLGHVTRARLTQIMNLLLLAPDIQEEVLFLPRTTQGRDAVKIANLQPIACTLSWPIQRKLWQTQKMQLLHSPSATSACLDPCGKENQ